MSASVDITNLIAGMRHYGERAVDAAARGLLLAGIQIVGNAQQLCPVDTGALQASGTWTEVEVFDAGRLEMTVGFNTSYAMAVHERLDVHHEIGQAKFLETAITQAVESGMVVRAVEIEMRKLN